MSAEPHTPEAPVIDSLTRAELLTAFEHQGCPLCWMLRRASRRYLYHVLHEYVLDGGLRVKLHRALGFCRQHAWELQALEAEEWRDGMGTATLYEDLARSTARAIRDAAAAVRPRRRWPWTRRQAPAPSPLQAAGECPACASTRASDAYATSVLMQALAADEEFKQRFAASFGLCLPHFTRALNASADESARRVLAEVQAEKLQRLADELGDYIRKHTVGHHDEPKGREQTSWIRVIEQFVGRPDR